MGGEYRITSRYLPGHGLKDIGHWHDTITGGKRRIRRRPKGVVSKQQKAWLSWLFKHLHGVLGGLQQRLLARPIWLIFGRTWDEMKMDSSKRVFLAAIPNQCIMLSIKYEVLKEQLAFCI